MSWLPAAHLPAVERSLNQVQQRGRGTASPSGSKGLEGQQGAGRCLEPSLGPAFSIPCPHPLPAVTRIYLFHPFNMLINHRVVPSTMPHDLQKLPLCFHDLHLQTQGPLHKQSFSAQLLPLWLLLLLIMAVVNTAET